MTPEGASELARAGFRVTVEESEARCFPIGRYRSAGCEIAAPSSWPSAPPDAIVLGLKELPDDGTPLMHRHVMFGHAFKGQPGAEAFLRRFARGGGALYDLEHLVDGNGGRVAAFGYWAGFAGAAMGARAWAAQRLGIAPEALRARAFGGRDELLADLLPSLEEASGGKAGLPSMLVVGALGRAGRGACDLARRLELPLEEWDVEETRGGRPFPGILRRSIFVNCILARPGAPVFLTPRDAAFEDRELTVISDVSCDPGSSYNPVRVYDEPTSFDRPVARVAFHPARPLDVTAIDNLPSILPLESSEDYAAQLLPHLLALPDIGSGVWRRAKIAFEQHSKDL